MIYHGFSMLLRRIEGCGTSRSIVESFFGIVSVLRISRLDVIFLNKLPINTMRGSMEQHVTDLFIGVTHVGPTGRYHFKELAMGKVREALLEFVANFILEQKVRRWRTLGGIRILRLLRGFSSPPFFASLDLFFSVVIVENFSFAFPIYLTDARRNATYIFCELLCNLGAGPHSLGH